MMYIMKIRRCFRRILVLVQSIIGESLDSVPGCNWKEYKREKTERNEKKKKVKAHQNAPFELLNFFVQGHCSGYANAIIEVWRTRVSKRNSGKTHSRPAQRREMLVSAPGCALDNRKSLLIPTHNSHSSDGGRASSIWAHAHVSMSLGIYYREPFNKRRRGSCLSHTQRIPPGNTWPFRLLLAPCLIGNCRRRPDCTSPKYSEISVN